MQTPEPAQAKRAPPSRAVKAEPKAKPEPMGEDEDPLDAYMKGIEKEVRALEPRRAQAVALTELTFAALLLSQVRAKSGKRKRHEVCEPKAVARCHLLTRLTARPED